ncbi:MAG: hypothetical protein HZC16_00650, partial [Candidatus Omnitrophica bacterium]|nr:hypothetical protein [Candidatus Omnitrophota bacterium]
QRTRTNARTRKGPRRGGMIVIKQTEEKKKAPAAPVAAGKLAPPKGGKG